MAKLGIREYAELPQDAYGREVPVGLEPPIAVASLDVDATLRTHTLDPATRFVRLHTDTICQFDIAETPAPSTGGPGRMAADQTEYFGVRVGLSHQIGVIVDT